MKNKWVIVLTAIVVIGALEGYALYLGMNGALLSGVFVIIAGLGGFAVKSIVDKVTKK